MKRRGIVSLALAGVLTSAMSIAVSAPASASDLTYRLHNASYGLCLQPVNGTQDAGAAVVQERCDSSLPQDWVFHRLSVSRPLYRIENLLSHQCLDALGGATNGTRVVQWPCVSISNETWDTGVGLTGFPTAVTVKSRVSGTTSHCLDVPGGQLDTPGLPMQIWGCNGTDAQTWILLQEFSAGRAAQTA
jgi:hypothetical protein